MGEAPAELLALADALYAEPPPTFTATRDALAREQQDKALAKQVKALRKPSVAAWAVNLLVRRESEQIDQVLGVAEALRAAAEAMDADELRTLTRQRRQLTTALATTARALAREHEVKLSASTVDQVEDMLNAAMLDPLAASVVRSGLVLTGFTSSGVGDLDPGGLVALPEAVGFAATPVERERPRLSVVPEDDAVRRARAQDALAAAEEEASRARNDVSEIEATLAELDARRLQLAEEIDETKRRLASLESDLDGVEDDIEDAEAARDEARDEASRREKGLEEAQKELSALG
jgi:hypothetical protein